MPSGNEPQRPAPIVSLDPKANGEPSVKKGGLAAIVGVAVAAALFQSIPADESGRKVKVTMDAAGSPTITHVSGKQYLKVYLDMVGVKTACDGLTRDEFGRPMQVGRQFTEAQCTMLLERALIAHAEGVMRCSPGLAVSQDAAIEKPRQGPRYASVSVAYNLGIGAYCGSTARRLFNAHQYPQGCTALTRFNRAGGKVVKGLVLRRQREFVKCTKGLA